MNLRKSEFKLIKRGSPETLVLIPGWGFDNRIFSTLNFNYNYLLPVNFSPFTFNEGLAQAMDKESLAKVSLLGWSLGGFLAAGFAKEFPGKVGRLDLLNIRESFPEDLLESIKSKVRKDKKAFLRKFYLECFSQPDSQGLLWFKQNLLKDYIGNITEDELIEGLEYFSGVNLNPAGLSEIEKIRIFHGETDAIAPIEEARQIASELKHSEFFSIAKAGHILFFNPEFIEKINA